MLLERLVENWLDNASERSYQSVFCQILASKNFRVLHSTRHSQIELGKDVLALDEQSKLHAYQLKGNPGARLTKGQFSDIQSQLIELVTQPVVFPGLPAKAADFTYLVTNGGIDEEASLALVGLNRTLVDRGLSAHGIALYSRGDFLADLRQLGIALWPDALQETKLFLELLSSDGDDILPMDKLDRVLRSILQPDRNSGSVSSSEIVRRTCSAALLTEIAISKFRAKDNHLACIEAWTLCSVAAVSCAEQRSLTANPQIRSFVSLARQIALDSVSDLLSEAIGRPRLIEGNGMVDFISSGWRHTTLLGYACLEFAALQQLEEPDAAREAALVELIKRVLPKSLLWGEHAIPSYLLLYWYLCKTEHGVVAEMNLAALLRAILTRNAKETDQSLMGPYHTVEMVVRYQLRGFLPYNVHDEGEETFERTSWFAEPLMHILVRRNMKSTCKDIWPEYSKFGLMSFIPPDAASYASLRSTEGKQLHRINPLTKEWSELQAEADAPPEHSVPGLLSDDPVLWALFLLIAPHRATPYAVRTLDSGFEKFLDW